MARREPKIQVYPGADGQWYWRLKARNGEIQCPSEGYKTRASAVRGAAAAQKSMAVAVIEVVDT